MNLHGIVRGAIGAVNPDINGQYLRSSGYGQDASYKQIAKYDSPVPARMQVQGVGGEDLAHLYSMNIQGVFRTVYMYGYTVGVLRPDGTGGDILNFPQAKGRDAESWKVVLVKEAFQDWCCVVVQLQTELVTS